MSCFVTFVLFHERAFSATTARVCDSAPTGSESPPSSGLVGPARTARTPNRVVTLLLCARRTTCVQRKHVRALRAPHFCISPAALRRTVSRPQEWDERPTNKIPVLKVFGLRINSLRKYSIRWTCPNLSMSKADTVSQVFTTQK